jgi:hypothetical protein
VHASTNTLPCLSSSTLASCRDNPRRARPFPKHARTPHWQLWRIAALSSSESRPRGGGSAGNRCQSDEYHGQTCARNTRQFKTTTTTTLTTPLSRRAQRCESISNSTSWNLPSSSTIRCFGAPAHPAHPLSDPPVGDLVTQLGHSSHARPIFTRCQSERQIWTFLLDSGCLCWFRTHVDGREISPPPVGCDSLSARLTYRARWCEMLPRH